VLGSARVRAWVLIERAETPDGGALELWQRGDEFSIRSAGRELMGSSQHGSEQRLSELAMAALGQAALGKAARPRVLIGGLGFGYTLAAALSVLGSKARVVVDEISPAVIAWNRGALGELAGQPLRDPRVLLRAVDVIDDLMHTEEPFEVILLDVDNGPSALSQARNAWLYGERGLARLSAVLSPGGVLGVWSAGPDPRFVKRLRAQRFRVDEHRVHAFGARGKRHTIWIAKRSS
jgi:spermidine synthase